jgi:hypothetical protein
LPTGERLSVNAAARQYASAVNNLTNWLVSKGARVVLYLDSAQFPNLESNEMCQPQWFYAVTETCHTNKVTFLKRRDELLEWVKNWSDGERQIVWDSMDESTCDRAGICLATHYKDSNHFKEYYAAFIFRKFVAQNASLFSN